MSQKVKRAVEKVEKLGQELESAKQQNEPEDQCRRLVKAVLFLCLSFTTYITYYHTPGQCQYKYKLILHVRFAVKAGEDQSVWPSRAMSAL
jgi:hypothetical protein